jgi:hypothetical protein
MNGISAISWQMNGFSAISWWHKLHWMNRYYTIMPSWIYMVLTVESDVKHHNRNSLKQQYVGRSLHSDTLSWFLVLSTLCWVLSGEVTNNKFKLFVLTGPELEPTIYQTRSIFKIKTT